MWFKSLLSRLDKMNITHGLFALVIALPASLTAYYLYIAIAICAYFYGRERRDHERQAKLDPHKDWYIGHWPFIWSDNTKRDLFSSLIGAWAPLPLYLWCFYG